MNKFIIDSTDLREIQKIAKQFEKDLQEDYLDMVLNFCAIESVLFFDSCSLGLDNRDGMIGYNEFPINETPHYFAKRKFKYNQRHNHSSSLNIVLSFLSIEDSTLVTVTGPNYEKASKIFEKYAKEYNYGPDANFKDISEYEWKKRKKDWDEFDNSSQLMFTINEPYDFLNFKPHDYIKNIMPYEDRLDFWINSILLEKYVKLNYKSLSDWKKDPSSKKIIEEVSNTVQNSLKRDILPEDLNSIMNVYYSSPNDIGEND